MIEKFEDALDFGKFLDKRFGQWEDRPGSLVWRERCVRPETFLKEQEKRAKDKWDEFGYLTDLKFNSGNSQFAKLDTGAKLTPIAVRHLMKMAGVQPYQHLKTLADDRRETIRALRDIYLNGLVKMCDSKRFVRFRYRNKKSPVLRGIAHESYRPFENVDLVRAIVDILPPDTIFYGPEDDGDQLFIRAIFAMDLTDDEVKYHAGLTFQNSENLTLAVAVMPFVLLGPVRRVNRDGPSAIGFSWDTWGYVRDTIRLRHQSDFHLPLLRRYVQKIARQTERKAPDFVRAMDLARSISVSDVPAVIERVCRSKKDGQILGETFGLLWHDLWREHTDRTAYGVVHAFGRAATTLKGQKRVIADGLCGRLVLADSEDTEEDTRERWRKFVISAAAERAGRKAKYGRYVFDENDY